MKAGVVKTLVRVCTSQTFEITWDAEPRPAPTRLHPCPNGGPVGLRPPGIWDTGVGVRAEFIHKMEADRSHRHAI